MATRISRKARIWPGISREEVIIPPPPQLPATPQFSMLTTAFVGLINMGIYALIFTRVNTGGSSLFFLPFIAISGLMALSSLTTFLIQFIYARRRSSYLVEAYMKQLQETERHLQLLTWQERQASIDQDPPLALPSSLAAIYKNLAVKPLTKRPYNEQDIELWARRVDDPDFLSVRIGQGKRPASYQVKLAQMETRVTPPGKLDHCNDFARRLIEQYTSIIVPLKVTLADKGPVAIAGAPHQLQRARELAHSMVCQIAYHHSPEDVRVIILAPQSQETAWQWAQALPHTTIYDPRHSGENADEFRGAHAVAIGNAAVLEQLPLLSRELGRRELLQGDAQEPLSFLPRLVIIVDHFDPVNDLDPTTAVHMAIQPATPVHYRPHLSISPLKRPEMTLALSRGSQLGVSVLCICAGKAGVPTTCGTLVDLEVTPPPAVVFARTTPQPYVKGKQFFWQRLQERHETAQEPVKGAKPEQQDQLLPQAFIKIIQPEPPPAVACELVDQAPVDALYYFARQMQPLHVASTKPLEIRTQVDLRMLFDPPIAISHYHPEIYWNDPAFRTPSFTGKSMPLLRIPIGVKIGDEIQYLDLLKDGPHGLLIGQTGSGKSELLQTIILALAIAYRPTEVTFLLIDYKAGLALEPFRHLPHTIGFLSNVSSPAQIQRFITMLRAEATRRELRLKEGKALPRLVIIIDEFAEMAKRTEAVLDELFTITRVGREIGMHLLLAAQRPEGIIGTRVRDYVQYRLCLRCASPEDSREILRRVDAAYLPASIPGRGYLLHGDNQLDLFQAARVTMPALQEHQRLSQWREPITDKEKATVASIPEMEKEQL